MVTARHAMLLMCLLGASCCQVALSARMEFAEFGAQLAEASTHRRGCPEIVRQNAKGDCIDQRGGPVPRKCCGSVEQCTDQVAEGGKQLQAQVAVYLTKCGVLQTDIAVPQDGVATVVNSSRICSTVCQDMPREEALLDFDGDAILSECESHVSTTQLELQMSILSSLEKAWMACSREEEPPTSTSLAPVFGELVNRGSTVGKLIHKNRAVKSHRVSSSALPSKMPSGLTGWQHAEGETFRVINTEHLGYDGDAVTLDITPSWYWGGGYKGAGQFLNDVKLHVKPYVEKSWWSRHYVKAKVVKTTVHNLGTASSPLALLILTVDLEWGNHFLFWTLNKWKRRVEFHITGDGRPAHVTWNPE